MLTATLGSVDSLLTATLGSVASMLTATLGSVDPQLELQITNLHQQNYKLLIYIIRNTTN
jgi:hypothetical protein